VALDQGTGRTVWKTDGFLASPDIAGSALILRSPTHLYRVES
jgi:hypothetical protein